VGVQVEVGGGMPSCGGGPCWTVVVVLWVAVTEGGGPLPGIAPGCGGAGPGV